MTDSLAEITPYIATILSKMITCENVNGHISGLQEPWSGIAQAINKTPPNPTRREQAFKTAIADRPDSVAINRAVVAADPLANLDDMVSSPKTFADIGNVLGPITWAWDKWLPTGFVTILASESGTGKSALALRLCDCFLRGKSWPDDTPFTGEGGCVLWCEAEAAQAINYNRAKDWGMPLERIYTPVEELENLNLDLPSHRAAIFNMSNRPEVRLVVIDSLSGADSKAEKGTEESMTIQWLAEVARDSKKPILVTHHLRKRSLFDGDKISLDRLRGSSAIVQMARVVWALDTPDEQDKDWKRLQVVKSNLSQFPDSVGVHIDETGVNFGNAPEQPKTETVIDRAVDLLLALLRNGPMSAKDIESEFTGAGISNPTMKRAKERLKIVSKKDSDGWKWVLPVRQYDK